MKAVAWIFKVTTSSVYFVQYFERELREIAIRGELLAELVRACTRVYSNREDSVCVRVCSGSKHVSVGWITPIFSTANGLKKKYTYKN